MWVPHRCVGRHRLGLEQQEELCLMDASIARKQRVNVRRWKGGRGKHRENWLDGCVQAVGHQGFGWLAVLMETVAGLQ